jgi:hypothetical protein
MIWPLWLAWRFDNWNGTFLIIVSLIYIVILVIGLLFAGIVAMTGFSQL